jgi:hypothetical protein
MAAIAISSFAQAGDEHPGEPMRGYLFDEGEGGFAEPLEDGVAGVVDPRMQWSPGAFGYPGDFSVDNMHHALGAAVGHVELDEEYDLLEEYTFSIWLHLNPAVEGDGYWGSNQGEIFLSAFPGGDEMKMNRAGFFNMPTGEQATFSAHLGGSTWYDPSNYVGGTPLTDYPPAAATAPYRGWHHFCYVYREFPIDGFSNWLYWDGQLMGTPQFGATIPPAADWSRTWPTQLLFNGLALGGDVSSNPWGHAGSWWGGFDEFAFYDRALNENEVRWLSNNSLIDTVAPRGSRFRRGDVNDDSQRDVSDVVSVLLHLFAGRPGPSCVDSMDGNDDGVIDVSDAVYLLDVLFGGDAVPLHPARGCGEDPTDDGLSCAASSSAC